MQLPCHAAKRSDVLSFYKQCCQSSHGLSTLYLAWLVRLMAPFKDFGTDHSIMKLFCILILHSEQQCVLNLYTKDRTLISFLGNCQCMYA